MPRPVLPDPVMPTITPCVVRSPAGMKTGLPLRLWAAAVDLLADVERTLGDVDHGTSSARGGLPAEDTTLQSMGILDEAGDLFEKAKDKADDLADEHGDEVEDVVQDLRTNDE